MLPGVFYGQFHSEQVIATEVYVRVQQMIEILVLKSSNPISKFLYPYIHTYILVLRHIDDSTFRIPSITRDGVYWLPHMPMMFHNFDVNAESVPSGIQDGPGPGLSNPLLMEI